MDDVLEAEYHVLVACKSIEKLRDSLEMGAYPKEKHDFFRIYLDRMEKAYKDLETRAK